MSPILPARLCSTLLVGMTLLTTACGPSPEEVAVQQAIGGDAERGRRALYDHGCGTCHQIDGIRGANGRVGPPLNGVAERWVLAGVLPNTPENMVRWIQDPKRYSPQTVMPRLHLSDSEARDIVAYLYLSER